MAWRFTGRARVDARDPHAFGVCDRCGFWFSLSSLSYQYDYRGPQLVNLRLRVCPRCTDTPFIFFKPIVYPPDPVPVADPRLQNFTAANQGTYPLPPLPWPVVPIGPSVPGVALTSDRGVVLVGDDGQILTSDQSPLPPSDPADSDIGGNPPPPITFIDGEAMSSDP